MNLLAEKKQWDLLTIGFATVPYENFPMIFNNSSVLRQSVQSRDEIYHQFQKSSKKCLINAFHASHDTLWDQINFLVTGCENLYKAEIFSESDYRQIWTKVNALVKVSCKKARNLSVEEELKFIEKVFREHKCTDDLKPWLLNRIETGFQRLLNEVHGKVISFGAADEGGCTSLEKAVYQKNWSAVIEELVQIPVKQWADLRGFIADPSANLAIKAYLLSAPPVSIENSQINKLDLLLAAKLIGIAQKKENPVAYLENALEHSVLYYAFGGDAEYLPSKKTNARIWIEKAMNDLQPNSLLDDFCEQNLPVSMDMVNFLATCESTQPLPCKDKNKVKISERCQGSSLSQVIIEHYQLTPEADDNRTSDEHRQCALELKQLLSTKYRLVFMLGSAAEVIRKAYNRQHQLAFIKRLEESPEHRPCENNHYSDFFYGWLNQLDQLIRHKCGLFRKQLSASISVPLVSKTSEQMMAELKTLDLLRTALVGIGTRLAQRGLDLEFFTRLQSSLTTVMQNYTEGFAKHGKGVLGPYSSKVTEFCNNLILAAETVHNAAIQEYSILSL